MNLLSCTINHVHRIVELQTRLIRRVEDLLPLSASNGHVVNANAGAAYYQSSIRNQ